MTGFNLSKAHVNLSFTCAQCNANSSFEGAKLGCAQCGNKIFKVSGSGTGLPHMYDPNALDDPYRKKKNNPERDKQFTNIGSEEDPSSSAMGGPDIRFPSAQDKNYAHPLSLPSDGDMGDVPPANPYPEPYVPDDKRGNRSPLADLNNGTKVLDKNPFNKALRNRTDDDPYEQLRRRRFKTRN